MTTSTNKQIRKARFINDRLSNSLYIQSVIVFLIVSVTGYFNLTINAVEILSESSLQKTLFQATFALHLLSSLIFTVIISFYIFRHIRLAKHHANVKARLYGSVLSALILAVIISGTLLIRGAWDWEIPKGLVRSAIYILHIALPLIVAYYFRLHRNKAKKRPLASPFVWPTILISLLPLLFLNIYENTSSLDKTKTLYPPSLMKVNSTEQQTVQADDFLDNDYCLSCHQDIHESWSLSAHRFSSFNNPFYQSSILKLQEKLLLRDGNTRAARFCAGCHDPLILMENGFDETIEDHNHKHANAGLTCTFCHSISSIDSSKGNADFSVAPPIHYPFAKSTNPSLRKVSDLLLRSNPEFHKQMFAKPVLESAELCGSCHKVHLPEFLNKYRWLRGQNHYDSFRLSGVSGTNVNSFFYPNKVTENCQTCHMKLIPSSDPSAELDFVKGRMAKNHQFAAGNSALSILSPEKSQQITKTYEQFLKNSVTVDIVGLRKEGQLNGQFIPTRENNSVDVKPGHTYIAEVVIRTRSVGHLFTNGTTDSNQVWLSLTLNNDTDILSSSGTLDPDGSLPQTNTHLIKSLLVDKDGNEIKKRNVEDIVANVFNHQIPPGASSVAHYKFTVPSETDKQLRLRASLNYRKFDKQYVAFSFKEAHDNIRLPIIEISSQSVLLTSKQTKEATFSTSQLDRLLDYGIALYRKPNKSEFRQAEEILSKTYNLGSLQAGITLLRLFYDEGRIGEAQQLLNQLREQKPFNTWTLDWYASKLAGDLGNIKEKANLLEKIVNEEHHTLGGSRLNFAKDDKVILELAETHFSLAQLYSDNNLRKSEQLEISKNYYLSALENDSENAQAHYGLWKTFKLLDNEDQAQHHQALHQKYKRDEVAFSHAVAQARQKHTEWDKEASLYRVYTLK